MLNTANTTKLLYSLKSLQTLKNKQNNILKINQYIDTIKHNSFENITSKCYSKFSSYFNVDEIDILVKLYQNNKIIPLLDLNTPYHTIDNPNALIYVTKYDIDAQKYYTNCFGNEEGIDFEVAHNKFYKN